ncbi:MAG: hypothetical protein H0Z24_08715 [Thermosipho sp. (in: Bacteria)]|nr:hypothetical protein [Thermosipho sp. (in: thermotogales)]
MPIVCGAVPFRSSTERDKLVKQLKKEFGGAVKICVDRRRKVVDYVHIATWQKLKKEEIV